MSKKLRLAETLSAFTHDGQRYGDADYYNTHILDVVDRVARKVQYLPEKDKEYYIISAYLHDLLEDTGFTVDTLLSLFGYSITMAVQVLSKTYSYVESDGEVCRTRPDDYATYVSNIKMNSVALLVKICDTESNLAASIADGNQKRIAKYTKQLEMLLE